MFAATILLKKPDPGVSIVRLRVCAGGVERAFDGVRGAGDVRPAFNVRERRSHQHQQEPDDADDDEQFEQRKTPNAFGVTWLRHVKPECFRSRGFGSVKPRSGHAPVRGQEPSEDQTSDFRLLIADSGIPSTFDIRLPRRSAAKAGVSSFRYYIRVIRLPRRSAAKAGHSFQILLRENRGEVLARSQ